MRLLRLLERYGFAGVLTLVFLLSSVFVKSFFTLPNILNIFGQSLVVTILGFGLTIILIAGEIDLSFAGWVPLASTIFAQLLMHGVSPLLALLVILVLGGVMGLFMSLLVVKVKVSSFVSSIGVMFLLLGVNHYITGGNTQWITGLVDRNLFYGSLGGIPKPVLILLLLFLILYILINHTQFGTYLKATGEDQESSKALGINTGLLKTWAFILGIILFSFAAVLQTIRVSGAIEQSGMTLMLPVMAVAYVGQVAIEAGRPTILGTFMAAFLVGLMNNSFALLQFPFWYAPLIEGIILVVAVAVKNIRGRKIVQVEF